MFDQVVAGDTYYDILGVARNASVDEVAQAYRRLVKRVHPDSGGNSALFRAVDEAYRTLSSPTTRADYDGRLDQRPGDSTRAPGWSPTARSDFYGGHDERRRDADAAAAWRRQFDEAAARARAEEAAWLAWETAQAQARQVEAQRLAMMAAEAAARRARADRLAWKKAGYFQRYPAASLVLAGSVVLALALVRSMLTGRFELDSVAYNYVLGIGGLFLATGLAGSLGWLKLRPARAPTKYSRPYGARLLGAELRAGAPILLKLGLVLLVVPLAALVVVAAAAGASAASAPGRSSH